MTDRNTWIIYWICCFVGLSIFNFFERALIGIVGENLTFNVRKELIRGIMYKQLSWFDSE